MIMKEIGRLRELAFRAGGGGSGKSADIDEYDTMEKPYRQMFVWDPQTESILGAYRYICGSDMTFDDGGQPKLASSHMFRFSEKFCRDYLPQTIELGRSFVTLGFQSTGTTPQNIFVLDNLWDGLAAIMLRRPDMKYFFGKATMYPSYNSVARDILNYFLWKHFPDPDLLVRPFQELEIATAKPVMDALLPHEDFKQDYRSLKQALAQYGEKIPPLFNSYMNTSPTVKMFGSAYNHDFSEVIETAILVNFYEMYPEKRDRHSAVYNETKKPAGK